MVAAAHRTEPMVLCRYVSVGAKGQHVHDGLCAHIVKISNLLRCRCPDVPDVHGGRGRLAPFLILFTIIVLFCPMWGSNRPPEGRFVSLGERSEGLPMADKRAVIGVFGFIGVFVGGAYHHQADDFVFFTAI